MIDFKPITNINNIPDHNGKGSVNYEFLMSEFPITNEIYCEFLNSMPKSFSPLYNLTKPQNINAFKKKFQSEIIYEKRKFIPANSLIGQFPITNISYTDMRSFVLWLNKIDSKQNMRIVYFLFISLSRSALKSCCKATFQISFLKFFLNSTTRDKADISFTE